MALPGGPADKLGNRYENCWTVNQMVRMLQGFCESIRIENPGIDKAEFALNTEGGIQEWHQAKRSFRPMDALRAHRRRASSSYGRDARPQR